MVMVGMKMGGRPIDDYAPDLWLVSGADGGDPIGYLDVAVARAGARRQHLAGVRPGGDVRRWARS